MTHHDTRGPNLWGLRLGSALIFVAICAFAVLSTSAFADELTRRADVDATPDAVWFAIGPFCSIADWHPAVGTCTEDGKTPPTRTLVTKDGKFTFVEPQTGRSEAKRFYSYTFVGQPFPVSSYEGTIHVVPKGKTASTVIWHGVYTPLKGKAKEARSDFAAIYEAGLSAIQAKFAH